MTRAQVTIFVGGLRALPESGRPTGMYKSPVWTLGTAQLQVSQPRNPCWKIDERFGCPGMAAFIADTGLTGWYWRVIRPGRVAPGDALERVSSAEDAPTLHEAMALWREHRPALAALARIAETAGIAPGWRDRIVQRLSWLNDQS